jgi:polyisoprenoid-binding protein YceI
MKLHLTVFTTLLLTGAPTYAQGIDYAASRLGFTFTQMNVPVDGHFKKFRADIRFDSAKPERSRAEIEVDLKSIDSGSSDGDTEAQRKAWFDTAAHPTAKFVSSSVRRTGADRYEVHGTLTIKGRSQSISAPVSVQRAAGAATYDGTFTLKRLAFAIGEGPWADTDTVADAVQVRFRIVQRAAKP